MGSRTRKYIRDGRAPLPQRETTSRIMSSIRDRNTTPELNLRKKLWQYGVRGYRVHWKKALGRPDIAFPGKKVAVFVNGCFWHRCPYCNPRMPKSNSEFWKTKFEKNKERDQRKINQLIDAGWKSLIIWECKLKNNCVAHVEIIKKLLTGN